MTCLKSSETMIKNWIKPLPYLTGNPEHRFSRVCVWGGGGGGGSRIFRQTLVPGSPGYVNCISKQTLIKIYHLVQDL